MAADATAGGGNAARARVSAGTRTSFSAGCRGMRAPAPRPGRRRSCDSSDGVALPRRRYLGTSPASRHRTCSTRPAHPSCGAAPATSARVPRSAGARRCSLRRALAPKPQREPQAGVEMADVADGFLQQVPDGQGARAGTPVCNAARPSGDLRRGTQGRSGGHAGRHGLRAELVRREVIDVDDVHHLAIVVAQHRRLRLADDAGGGGLLDLRR